LTNLLHLWTHFFYVFKTRKGILYIVRKNPGERCIIRRRLQSSAPFVANWARDCFTLIWYCGHNLVNLSHFHHSSKGALSQDVHTRTSFYNLSLRQHQCFPGLFYRNTLHFLCNNWNVLVSQSCQIDQGTLQNVRPKNRKVYLLKLMIVDYFICPFTQNENKRKCTLPNFFQFP
jgi:hypothetical protein